jgi:hypothetical protein
LWCLSVLQRSLQERKAQSVLARIFEGVQ